MKSLFKRRRIPGGVEPVKSAAKKSIFRRRSSSDEDQPDELARTKHRSYIDLSNIGTATSTEASTEESTGLQPIPPVAVIVGQESEVIGQHDNQIPLGQANDAENDQTDEESLSSLPMTSSIDDLDVRVPPSRETGRVGFSSVEFKEYPVSLGDNPAVSRGIPITIGWEPCGTYEFDVDNYEDNRPPRRMKTQLKMDSLHRLRLLKRMGYSQEEIKARVEQVDIVKRRRHRTARLSHYGRVSEILERVKRASLNASFRRSQKKMERAQLAIYRTPKERGADWSWSTNTTTPTPEDCDDCSSSHLSVNMAGEVAGRHSWAR